MLVPTAPSEGGLTMKAFRHRILLVDDEAGVRQSMAGLLNNAGYDVATAEHGFDALLQLRTAPPPTSSSPI